MESKSVFAHLRFGQFLFESLLNLVIAGGSRPGLSGFMARAGCLGAFRRND
jgi:hypothetical protein